MLSQHTTIAWGFSPFIQAARAEGLLYDIPVLQGPADATIRLGHIDLVNFASINFLGFQQEAEVLAQLTQAAQTYGLVTGGSRLLQGVSQAHARVEDLMCRLTGKERAITFASGLLANQGFLHAMSARFFKGGRPGGGSHRRSPRRHTRL